MLNDLGKKAARGYLAGAKRQIAKVEALLGFDQEVNSRPPVSRLAYRADGRVLVSLEDAMDRDLTGREVLAFLVLNEEELAIARETSSDAGDAAAARILARLPIREL